VSRPSRPQILQNQITVVPVLSTWVSRRVALAGDAAHGMSPHITAGASLGVEDAVWLAYYLGSQSQLAPALAAY
jgi:2-polyprenyl-6-methoxyphenol hydroxylase-like FAD-dependent oxidoreductase